MSLNPFKEANLDNLQDSLVNLFNNVSDRIIDWLDHVVTVIHTKGRKRVTLMIVPHSEKKIVHFQVSNYVIFISSFIFTTVVILTSAMIINHSSTVKEISRLRIYGNDSQAQIQLFKDEINKLYDSFQQFKPELTYLFSLTPDNYVDSLWAKGGAQAAPGLSSDETGISPSIEELNIEEMQRELEVSRKVLVNVKTFLKNRKKIIENTPSIWPARGYIVSPFGNRLSPFSLKEEFNKGIDIASFPGTEIKATAPGTIEEIKWDPVLGITIVIRHKYGFLTFYSHCQRVTVAADQTIAKGEIIGYVGKTGNTNMHILHYQIKIGTEYVDPTPYLNNIEYDIE